MEKSPALEIFGNIQMAVIYSPEVNAFAKLRSRLHYVALEMTSSVFKLFQEPQIVLEEHSQIVDLVFQHRDTFNTHAESESGVLFRVDVAGLEDVRVADAAAQNLNPARMFAYVAAFAAADVARDIHLG